MPDKGVLTDIPASQFQCDDGQNFCLHADAGLWSVVATSPYFDHVYQIAGTSDGCQPAPCKVTFFPILQPVILWAGSLAAFSIFLMFLWALCRPWAYPPRLARHPGQGE